MDLNNRKTKNRPPSAERDGIVTELASRVDQRVASKGIRGVTSRD